MILEVAKSAVVAIVGGIIGYLFWRIKKMEDRLEKAMSKEDIKELIKDKLEPVKVLIEEQSKDIKEQKQDIKDMDKKLDRLLERRN